MWANSPLFFFFFLDEGDGKKEGRSNLFCKFGLKKSSAGRHEQIPAAKSSATKMVLNTDEVVCVCVCMRVCV